MPFRQFLYFDAIECLPENVFEAPSDNNTTESNFAPSVSNKKSRYYAQELVFGHEFQQKLAKSKYFVVRFLFNTEKKTLFSIIILGRFRCNWV